MDTLKVKNKKARSPITDIKFNQSIFQCWFDSLNVNI